MWTCENFSQFVLNIIMIMLIYCQHEWMCYGQEYSEIEYITYTKKGY